VIIGQVGCKRDAAAQFAGHLFLLDGGGFHLFVFNSAYQIRVNYLLRLVGGGIIEEAIEQNGASDNHHPKDHLSDCRVQNHLPPLKTSGSF
jgi:hypothetical protein